jgi:hypothetical protein
LDTEVRRMCMINYVYYSIAYYCITVRAATKCKVWGCTLQMWVRVNVPHVQAAHMDFDNLTDDATESSRLSVI